MEKKVNIKYCDECGFNEKSPISNIATRVCIFCEKDYCQSKHTPDTYSSYSHFTNKPNIGFICEKCFDICRSSKKLQGVKKLMDKRASGSTFAIAIAEFYDGMVFELKKIADEKLLKVMQDMFHEREKEFAVKLQKEKLEQEYRQKLSELQVH